MKHKEKILWMTEFCKRNNVQLELAGECGFARKCVGITIRDTYPDYEWYDNDYNRIDPNGEVWTPEDAYHKHPCVAVLGRGEEAEIQLYKWLKWFDKNDFEVESVVNPNADKLHFIELIIGKDFQNRIIKRIKRESK